MGIALVLLVGFFAFEAAGYAFHRFLHTEAAGRLNRAHMNHHLQQYPPQDFTSDVYRSAGGDTTLYPFLVGGVALAGLLCWLLPLAYALPLLAELAFVGWLNNAAHDATHLRVHWLMSFRVYRRWRARHRVHHFDMTRNFGVVTFVADRAMGTYQEPQARHLMR